MFQSLVRAMTTFRAPRLRENVKAFGQDRRGTAAVEFAFFVGFLSVAVLNVAEISVYIYQRMQVANAAQMGVQAVWKTCNTSSLLPATTNCSGMTTAVNNSVQSTTLGARIQSSSPTEGYYCVTDQNALHYMSAVDSKPADCSAVGSTSQPADYITLQTTFNYTPMFAGLTIGGLFPTTIQQTTTMRLQ